MLGVVALLINGMDLQQHERAGGGSSAVYSADV